ncbi:Thymidylate kinase [Lachnellula subtilissima]|uniref:Thymidylate kinase n=1 Tax=Lachnellula subtilissima TaxID=602034 RepID=A0A8H8UCT3_9HELO|nr:Thymidylate kinase [Lachnellula subtilissima]
MASPSEDPYPWQEPAKPVSRGAFIVVEGLDRAGKSTQVKKLCDRLYAEGHNVKAIGFPDRTSPIGKMISSYLKCQTEMDDHAIHLLFTTNRWEKAQWVKDQIAHGYTLICDRYYYSGIVYSAAKRLPSLSLAWARQPEVGLPRPDRVMFLDLDPEAAVKRGGYGDEKYEKREMQERVRALFLGLLGRGGEESSDLFVVDAGVGVEDVAGSIWGEVGKVVNAVEGGKWLELGSVGAWEEEGS